MTAHDHAPAGRTAPRRDRHLMDPWRDDFLVELRLRDVPGRRIGDLLAEVEAHCAESGEHPAEAFGEPRAYAAVVAPGRPLRPGWQEVGGGAARGLGTALAALLLLSGMAGLRSGDAAQLSAGMLAVLGVTLLVVVVAVRRLDVVVRRPLWTGLAMTVVTVAGALSAALWRHAVIALPAWLGVIGGVALLAVCWWRMFTGGDPVVDPRTGVAPFTTPRPVLWLLWALPVLILLIGVAATLLA